MIANGEPLIKFLVPKKVNDASQIDQLSVFEIFEKHFRLLNQKIVQQQSFARSDLKIDRRLIFTESDHN